MVPRAISREQVGRKSAVVGVAIALLALLSPAPASATHGSAPENPGFESPGCPPPNWVLFGGNGGACTSTEKPRSGSYSLKIVDAGLGTSNGLASSAIATSPGDGRTASAWVSGGDSSGAYVFVEFLDASGIRVDAVSKSVVPGPGWTQVTVSAVAPAGTTSARMLIYSCVDCAGDFYVDDVSLSSGAGHPGPPRDLTAIPGPVPGTTTLRWSAPSSDGGASITNYRIYRGTASGGETFLVQTGNVLTYTDGTCAAGRTCFYRVAAVNSLGEGLQSNEASAPGTTFRPKTRDNLDGSCTAYNDANGNNAVDSGESISIVPCPKPKTQQNPNGTTTMYDDKNNDNAVDAGEEIATTPSVDPKIADNPDGTCTLYNDKDHDNFVDAGEELQTLACPDPKTRSNPDGSTTLYDDKDDDNVVDAGETLATTPVVDPKTRDNLDGSCTIYNDADHDGLVGAGEALATFPCPKPKTQTNPDGTITLYDDKNDNNTVDAGEAIATTPSVDPKIADNPDGTCTLYNDADHDGVVDAGEELQTLACPDPKTQSNPDGTITIYDDKDDDGVVDAGETLLVTPASPDQDGDGVPDAVEPELCAHENPNFNFEGTCQGDDYSPPTLQGIVEDVEKFLP